MDFSMLANRLYRPLTQHLTTSVTSLPQQQEANNFQLAANAGIFVSAAGCDINVGARVNLLYEMPLTLLARRFDSGVSDRLANFNKFKILIHELNGCIVGPGLYQEWTNYIYAARDKLEQNLELCRSPTNNMLYYHATKPIRMGEPLLAWYSDSVEEELCKNLLNREALTESPLNYKDTKCKHCHFNFEYVNILKSHLWFEFCGRRHLLDSQGHEQGHLSIQLKNLSSKCGNEPIFQKSASTTPPSSLSSSNSTTSSCSSTDSHKLLDIKREPKTKSAFSPIFQHNKSSKFKKSESLSQKHSHHQHHTSQVTSSPRSSTSSHSSSTCSPIQSDPNLPTSHQNHNSSKQSSKKKVFHENHNRVEDYLNHMHQHHQQEPKTKATDQHQRRVPESQDMTLPGSFNPDSFADRSSSRSGKNGVDWKITMLDGTQTVELNMSDELGKQKKTHVCLFCGKIYNRKYGLKIHLRTHTGYKPLKCKVCSRPFSDPSNLNKHVRLHSQGDTPYRCPYCGKILVRKRDLDRHIMSRHSGKIPGQMSDLNEAESIEYNENEMGNTDEEEEEEEIDMEEFDEDCMTDNNNDKTDRNAKGFNGSSGPFYQSLVGGQQDGSPNASPVHEMSIQKIIDS